MAKAKAKNGLTKFNKLLTIIFFVLLIATVLIIVLSGVEKQVEDLTKIDDKSVLTEEFAEGTYGGVSFKTQDDLVNYYIKCYDNTKAQTCEYKNEDGSTATFYKMLGEDKLEVKDLLVDGKENSMINGIVPGIVEGIFSHGLNGLPPSGNRDPNLDNDINGESLVKSRLTPDDVLAAYAVDNKDGTITLVMQPKMFELSTPGLDSQGKMFTTLGDITGVVSQISVLTWAQGDASENIIVKYMGGTAEVTIDTKKNEIVKADYHLVVKISVSHANVAVIKDKSASLTVNFDLKFPASDKYLKDTKGITRK